VAQIIEEYIAEGVNVIVFSTVKVEVIRQAIRKATVAGIPVIIVNQLEPIEETDVACYIGYDNGDVGAVSGYAVVDYLGGPGVLGRGPQIAVDPTTPLDLAWWQQLYQQWPPAKGDVRGRVAIIEGVSGSWQGEHRLRQAGDAAIDVDTTTFPIHSRTGEFLGLAAAFRDATGRKATEAALRRYSEELAALVAERTRDLQRTLEELQEENRERRRAEAENTMIIAMLQDALAQVKHLSGLLPICASCKKIRDDHGDWHQLETYIRDHSNADFSHSICPECRAALYGSRSSPL
jgi:ABC-type sugar transport system substrate-binding protein